MAFAVMFRRLPPAVRALSIGAGRDVITAIERWASSDDHQRHIQGDHVKRLMTGFDGIPAVPPEIVVMRPL
jgi:quinol monooxygenase YgiN